jgi:hypothetical protein
LQNDCKIDFFDLEILDITYIHKHIMNFITVPEGVSVTWQDIDYLTDKVVREMNKDKFQPCVICTETCNEYPYLCEHAVHYECAAQWLKTNPMKRPCFTCKAPMRHKVFLNIKPKTIDPAVITEEDKKMFVDMNYVECPSCKVWIEKEEGCNSLTCERCDRTFNFREQLLEMKGEHNHTDEYLMDEVLNGNMNMNDLVVETDNHGDLIIRRRNWLETLNHNVSSFERKYKGLITIGLFGLLGGLISVSLFGSTNKPSK